MISRLSRPTPIAGLSAERWLRDPAGVPVRMSRPDAARARAGQTGGVTRLIAGTAGGRRLSVPSGRDTRPTSDRAREGLFATIHSLLGDLTGLRAADLFAGSG